MRNVALKIVDAAVIVGGLAVGYGAVKTIAHGAKAKTGTILAFGILTGLIAVYAVQEAVHKIQE